MSGPTPPWRLDSSDRLTALAGIELVPGVADPLFDPYTRLVTRMLGVPVSLVSFVTDHQQVFASSSGLEEPWASRGATGLDLSFCRHVVASDEPLRVDDAPNHDLVGDNGAIEALGVQAYLGVPLHAPAGEPLGSMCAIDVHPRDWSDDDLATLEDIAAAASSAIALRIAEHRQRAEARDASHRLRTPITALRLELEDLASLHDLPAEAELGLRAAGDRLDDLSLVVDGMLTSARDGRHERYEDVDLVKLTASVADRRRLAATGEHVVHDAGAPVVVRTAPSSIRRVLELLVGRVLQDHDAARLRATGDEDARRVEVVGQAGPDGRGPDGDDLVLAREIAAGIGARISPLRGAAGYEVILPGAPTLRA